MGRRVATLRPSEPDFPSGASPWWGKPLARFLLWARGMANSSRFEDALALIHRNGATWKLHAELDPTALSELVAATAALMRVPPDVALRIIESELGLRPLSHRNEHSDRATRRELPRVPGPYEALPDARARWRESRNR
jgi:hypothetical protein